MPSSSLPATLLEDFSVCVSLEAGVTALEDSGTLASELEDLTSVELDAGLELDESRSSELEDDNAGSVDELSVGVALEADSSPHPTTATIEAHKQKARIKFLIYWNIPNYARKIC